MMFQFYDGMETFEKNCRWELNSDPLVGFRGGAREMKLQVSIETTDWSRWQSSTLCGHIVMWSLGILNVFFPSGIFQLVMDLWGYNSIRNQDSPVFISEIGKIFVDCLDLKMDIMENVNNAD